MNLELVNQTASAHLNKIAECFKSGVQLTLVVRTPGNSEADFVLSSERDLKEAIAALSRRIEAK